jgi:hypothetical protein
MLRRPRVAGPVAGGTAGQAPQHCGGPTGEAGDQAGEGGVHAGRAGQRPAHLGGPGQGGIAPVLREVPEDVGDVGGGELQPGVAEYQPGGLAGRPDQRPGAGGGAQADGQKLVAGAGERGRVCGPMAAGRQGRPGVMPHPSHPPTRTGCDARA